MRGRDACVKATPALNAAWNKQHCRNTLHAGETPIGTNIRWKTVKNEGKNYEIDCFSFGNFSEK
jgi:hypothetical protein